MAEKTNSELALDILNSKARELEDHAAQAQKLAVDWDDKIEDLTVDSLAKIQRDGLLLLADTLRRKAKRLRRQALRIAKKQQKEAKNGKQRTNGIGLV